MRASGPSGPADALVYRLRPFLNSDPPLLAAIWRSQPPQRGLLQPVTAPLLEYGVYSKMHFDRQGLIVALDGDVPVGFVHAGFGPSDDGLSLDTSLGTTLVLMVDPAHRETELADQLARRERRVSSTPRGHGRLRRRHQPAQLVLPGTIRRQRNPRRVAVRCRCSRPPAGGQVIAKSIACASCSATSAACGRRCRASCG